MSFAQWVIAADPQGAQERRKDAEADGDVSYRKRQDGLGDLFATAVPAPLLHAVLSRIRDAARPWGSDDDRTAGKRRLDAFLNLLLGRDTLPFGAAVRTTAAPSRRRPGGPAAPGAAAGSTRPPRAAPTWSCTSRSAPPSAPPTNSRSWSATDRSSPSSSRSSCSPAPACAPCTSTNTASPSASTTR